MIHINVMTARLRQNLANRRSYEKFRAERIIQHRAYNSAHPEQCRVSWRRYGVRHPDEVRAKDVSYKSRNFDKVRRWREISDARCSGTEERRAVGRKRRARKRGSIIHFTSEQWLALKRALGNRCIGCWKTETQLTGLGRKLVPDHIVPLAKGGMDDITNIQPLCHGIGGCNNIKGATYLDYLVA